MKKFFATALFLVGALAHAQKKQIIIETKNTALILSVGDNKRVTQSYFGKKLKQTDYS
jgi:alpha-galactosidase